MVPVKFLQISKPGSRGNRDGAGLTLKTTRVMMYVMRQWIHSRLDLFSTFDMVNCIQQENSAYAT